MRASNKYILTVDDDPDIAELESFFTILLKEQNQSSYNDKYHRIVWENFSFLHTQE
jgi:hypothetical protein